MKKSIRRSLFLLLGAGTLAAVLGLSGCQTTVDYQKLKFSESTVKPSGLLLPLEDASTGQDLNLSEQIGDRFSKIMIPGNQDKTYGFYVVSLGTPFQSSAAGTVWLTLNSCLLCIPSFFGMPVQGIRYSPTVTIYVFNSRGDQVDNVTQVGEFTEYSGVYYGHTPNAKAEKAFGPIIDQCLTALSGRSNRINALLKAGGPVDPASEAAARTKITRFLHGATGALKYTSPGG
jgi:hypothetical protein